MISVRRHYYGHEHATRDSTTEDIQFRTRRIPGSTTLPNDPDLTDPATSRDNREFEMRDFREDGLKQQEQVAAMSRLIHV